MPPATKSGGNTFCETVCNPANNMKSSCDRICPDYLISTSTSTAGPDVYNSEKLTPTWLIALGIVSLLVVLTAGFFGFKKFQTWRNKRKDFRLKHPQQEQGRELTLLVLSSNDIQSQRTHMVNTDNTISDEGENSNPNTSLLEEYNAIAASEQTNTSIPSSLAISAVEEPSSGYYSVPRKEGEPININTLKVRDANNDDTEVKLSLDT